ncbi:hypothetical protein CaLGV072 [Clostera anastomosis granulovirus A]|uniref:P12 n=1 Tax=Clostera anastomosis granulovirus A TaxID=1986289 RepID=U5KBA3_9BBAC|nr:hypothetical protein CaLGV072 [Clostera anastomosis granulovirus Henan]AGQ20330.1 hypothetical protein CaLGV072 [Clostera anastomosis granulovirus Henan]
MEDSLFNRSRDEPPRHTFNDVNNEALLQTLIMRGVGRHIKADDSAGKRAILTRLAPKTRALKRLISGLEEGDGELIVRGADDAVDVLEVVHAIVNSKFTLGENYEPMES